MNVRLARGVPLSGQAACHQFYMQKVCCCRAAGSQISHASRSCDVAQRALLLLILTQPPSSKISKNPVTKNDATVLARPIEIIMMPCEDARFPSFRAFNSGKMRG